MLWASAKDGDDLVLFFAALHLDPHGERGAVGRKFGPALAGQLTIACGNEVLSKEVMAGKGDLKRPGFSGGSYL